MKTYFLHIPCLFLILPLYITAKVFRAYSVYRNPDAEAICDLAMYNYIEVSLKTQISAICDTAARQNSYEVKVFNGQLGHVLHFLPYCPD